MPPPHPHPPGPGQESVWDYPRPPRVEEARCQVEVIFGGNTIAVSVTPIRVLETSHPPAYYFPPDAVIPGCLEPSGRASHCEFKGRASYLSLVLGPHRAPDAAWRYDAPSPGYEAIAGHVAFYPGRVDACLVDGELVSPQPGDFYGGWVTSGVVGPFKGGPGTETW